MSNSLAGRLGLSTYLTAGTRLTTAWLERAQDAGFTHIELYADRASLDYRDRGHLDDLARWFRDAHLIPEALHTPPAANIADTDRMRRRAHCDELKRSLEILESIPCRTVIQHFGVKDEPFHERRIDAAFSSLEELNVFARDRGASILLENGTSELAQPARLMQLLHVTHLPNGVLFDTGHAHLGHGGIETAYRAMHPRIQAVHIHDNAGLFDDHLLPRQGTIDWLRTLRLLRPHDHGKLVLMASVKDSGEWARPAAAVHDAMSRLLDIDIRLTEEEAREAEREESRRG